MALASNKKALENPCHIIFDAKIQQNMIETPDWFKPKTF